MERVSYCLKRESFFLYHSRQHLEGEKKIKNKYCIYTEHVDIQTLLYILVGGSELAITVTCSKIGPTGLATGSEFAVCSGDVHPKTGRLPAFISWEFKHSLFPPLIPFGFRQVNYHIPVFVLEPVVFVVIILTVLNPPWIVQLVYTG